MWDWAVVGVLLLVTAPLSLGTWVVCGIGKNFVASWNLSPQRAERSRTWLSGGSFSARWLASRWSAFMPLRRRRGRSSLRIKLKAAQRALSPQHRAPICANVALPWSKLCERGALEAVRFQMLERMASRPCIQHDHQEQEAGERRHESDVRH